MKKVVIDAGHGGNDPGAVNGNIYEKDFNLKAAQYMYKRLNELGIPATIIRDKDETLDRDKRVNRILNAYGNDKDVILISNHINAGGGEGAEVVYALRNSDKLAKSILEEIGKEGQIMRKYYQKRLPENPAKDYYFIHRLTGNIEPILLEYGFIDNTKDLNKLQNNLLDYVEAAVKAIANYTNTTYTSPNKIIDNVYIVKKGDSLYSIALKYNTTVDALKTENNLSSNDLSIGQRLKIPSKNSTNSKDDNYITYNVKKGDNLYSIAKEFDTTVDNIVIYNNLPSTNLYVNQQLLIPTKATMSNNYYTVKSGDSLYKIAKEFNTTVNTLIELNNLKSTILQVGDKLLIEENKSKNVESNNNDGKLKYFVKAGDSLYSIANIYGITVQELKELNNLNDNILVIGQQLLIPDSSKTYVVKKGDNLYSIASQNNTTVNEIKRINNLNSNILFVGQKLIIP